MDIGRNPLRQNLRTRLMELQTLRDELRVRLHLLGMDAKDAMTDLEPRIDRLESELEHAGDDALGVLATSLEKVAKSLKALRERHAHA
jgi:hypothetical protein